MKPEGQRLRFLVRVQMASINDVEWPITKPEGYLDLPVLEPFLRDAATMWIADYLEVYEGGTKLGKPALSEVRLSTEGDTSFATYETALGTFTQPNTRSHQIEFGPSTWWSRNLQTFTRYKVRFIDDPLIGVREHNGLFNTNQPEQLHITEVGATWTP